MHKIWAIAINTFREAVRNRILYIILIFATLLLLFSGILKNFTIADEERLIQNFGTGAINFFGLLISIFIGITLIYNELERKTIYTIISKPIDRSHFLLGKYFGLLLTIYVNILIMTLCFLISLHWQDLTDYKKISEAIYEYDGEQFVRVMPVSVFYLIAAAKSVGLGLASFCGLYTPDYAAGIMMTTWFTCLELAIITAFACMYSSFTSPTLSAIFTLLTVVAGRLCEDIYYFAQLMEHYASREGGLAGSKLVSYYMAIGAFLATPNLSIMNQRASVIYPEFERVDLLLLIYTALYAVVYTTGVLSVSIMIFRRRNFK